MYKISWSLSILFSLVICSSAHTQNFSEHVKSEAVNICTLRGARYLNKQFNTGSIEKGKAADLILMAGNLKTDPLSIRNIKYVFKDGIGYDSKAIFNSVKGKVGLY